MMAQPPKKLPKRKLRIDCGSYLLRTVTTDDASDAWAGWMDNPKNLRLVNSAPRTMTKADIATYIAQFDKRSHLLLGIFDKASGEQRGFFRIDIDPVLKRCLIFLLGEPRYQNRFLMREVTPRLYELIFKTLGLNLALATGLARNRALKRFLLSDGWNLDKTIPGHIKAHDGGAMLDLCFYSFSRASWQKSRANSTRLSSLE